MPYDANKSGSDQPATEPPPSQSPQVSNPFLQFVDPAAYRQLVERAAGRTEPGRLVTPLSRLHERKGGPSGLGRAWDEELADDAV
jgi:hypothetical protein